jgi:1,4-alpha-glucan branching enzyme
VVLVGSFNRWDTAVDHLTLQSDGWWTISLPLGPGQYPYLFLVDGVAWNDPDDDGRMPSEWGLDLSVRIVR